MWRWIDRWRTASENPERKSENEEMEREREKGRTVLLLLLLSPHRLCREAGRGCVPRIRAFIHLRHDILKIRARGVVPLLLAPDLFRKHGIICKP